jgi:hypothetical protein
LFTITLTLYTLSDDPAGGMKHLFQINIDYSLSKCAINSNIETLDLATSDIFLRNESLMMFLFSPLYVVKVMRSALVGAIPVFLNL